MKILVVGGGGREHALCWKLAQSPLVSKLLCAPGNPGIAELAECFPIGTGAVDQLLALAQSQAVDFVVVGPEQPLTLGLADKLIAAGIKVFGPSAAAAQLEGSKGFMKDLCARHNIPTARYARFSDAATARAYLAQQGAPIVIKADGLAAGKGVTVAMSMEDAETAIREALEDQRFGSAGAEIVIEEFMEGEEVSFFALVDGTNALPLASAQDHKRVGDGDTGPNTGGMGAYSPAPALTPALAEQVMQTIVLPTVAAMAAEGNPFRGVLYAGLMLTSDGPKLVEYNVRFGDPECQVLMPRLAGDLLPLLIACHDGTLDHCQADWSDDQAITVVLAARGYPGEPAKGGRIEGLAAANALDGVTVFHAGTKAGPDGAVLADGGRVLAVTGRAPSLAQARDRAYAGVDQIRWDDGFCRRDIGWRVLGR